MTSIELRQERAKLIEDAGAILAKAHDEDKRKLTPDEREKWGKLHDDADGLKDQINVIERQERADKELLETLVNRERANSQIDQHGDDAFAEFRGAARWNPIRRLTLPEEKRSVLKGLLLRAYDSWLHDPESMTEGERSLGSVFSKADAQRLLKGDRGEQRAQTVTTTGGGFLIPDDEQQEIDIARLAFGGMMDPSIVSLLRTSSGGDLPWPTNDDTGNTGRLLTINTAVTTTDIVLGQVVFGAFKYSSDQVLVPSELMQDSAVDLPGLIRGWLAERLGRIANNHLTVGDGSSKPNGIVTAASDSTFDLDISELAAGSINAFGDMLRVEHSVDPAYRPGAAWMMHDTLLRDLKGVVDSNGRPIFRDATDSPGQLGTILGYPVHINQDMADSGTATNKALLFGQLKKYKVRVVRPMVLFRLEERYRDADQTGFFAFERLDGDLIDAGTAPVKWADMIA